MRAMPRCSVVYVFCACVCVLSCTNFGFAVQQHHYPDHQQRSCPVLPVVMNRRASDSSGALVRRYDRKATPFYRFSMQTNACVHKMTIWCNNQNGLNLFLMRLYIHIRFNIVKCVCECLSMFRFRVAMNIQYWSDFFDGNAGNLHEPEVMAIYSFHSVGADCLRIPNAMRMLKKWAMVTCSMTILQAKERDSSIYTGQS